MSNYLLLILLPCVAFLWDVVEGQSCGCSPRFRRGSDTDFWEEVKNSNGSVRRGDVVYTKDDALLYLGKFRASIEANRRWPNGEVFYEMSRMNGFAQGKIRTALTALTQATGNCVRFTEVQANYRGPHVTVFAGNGCYSMIGRQGGRQDLSLGSNHNCLSDNGIIQHEFMHALGFHHEQTRRDRDQYINVNWNNIDSSQCHNFAKCMGCTLTTGYDSRSIMQYASWTFSCRNGAATMLTKNNQRIEYNAQLQQSDVKKIKDYYQCR